MRSFFPHFVNFLHFCRYGRRGNTSHRLKTTSAGHLLFAWLLICLIAVDSQAETKVFEHWVNQPFSGSQSPDDAYMAAMTKSKFEVLELAGTYLESLSVVENATLVKDEVTALAGGVLHVQVVAKENYANDQTFGIRLATRIEIDTGILHQRMDKLLKDRTLLSKYDEIHDREQELLARIRELEKANVQATSPSHKPNDFDNDFTELSAALTASHWLEKALTLWNHGQFTNPALAIDHLSQALTLDDENPRAYNSRAVAYLSLGKLQEAEQDLAQALKIMPDYADTHNHLGNLHYRRGDFQKAVDSFTRAISLQPDFADAIFNRGMAYRKLFNYEAAFDDFRKAAALAPASSITTVNAGSQVELHNINTLCGTAQTTASMALCRSLDFLRRHGFFRENTSAK
ncbi:MAG: tetratricopeptide repeat protein [Desulforhopalus sp.]|nr:tetratricopeptide repeat protein [Desulforhopalus sp.]